MIMSLVENMARRFPSPGDLIVEIDRLKQAGYSNVAIGKKLDTADSTVSGLLSLRNAGEERLLAAAVKGAIPLGVAIDISKAESIETQREMLVAYEGGKLNQSSIRVVRRLLTQRRSLGKGLHTHDRQVRKTPTTADGLVNEFKKESQRQRSLVRKAKVCDAHLTIITTAFRRLPEERIPRWHGLVGGEGVFHLLDLARQAEDAFAGNDGGDLVQAQRVVFDRQRGMNAADAVFTAELQHMGCATQRTKPTDLAGNLRNERENGGCDAVER